MSVSMLCADRVQVRNECHGLVSCRPVVERRCPRVRRCQHTRVEDTADHETDPELLASGKQPLLGGAIDQCVAVGEQNDVESDRVEHLHTDLGLVHPEAEGLDGAGSLQFLEGTDTATAANERLHMPGVVVPVPPPTDVVDIEDVWDMAAQAEAAILETSHDAVIGIVVGRLVGQRVDEREAGFSRRAGGA